MFGTRFGFSKIGNNCIIVLDCEGLFSIRRTEDEEVKLL
jgi:hypothetical protein